MVLRVSVIATINGNVREMAEITKLKPQQRKLRQNLSLWVIAPHKQKQTAGRGQALVP